jgi:hypothetical protein
MSEPGQNRKQNKYCHVYEFGLITEFINHLQIVTLELSLIHTLYNSLQHVLSLLSLLCLH